LLCARHAAGCAGQSKAVSVKSIVQTKLHVYMHSLLSFYLLLHLMANSLRESFCKAQQSETDCCLQATDAGKGCKYSAWGGLSQHQKGNARYGGKRRTPQQPKTMSTPTRKARMPRADLQLSKDRSGPSSSPVLPPAATSADANM